ncbi:putative DNA-binding domain-containing protein [Vibrio ostreicida]|uniref:HvfC/BufC family peptide modification chaperone n=1 Tax=Vibrio ostreicida TaxID=526588 RepID=UPI000971307E|nr:putative DNA-binding domain-containing protein [Vibrio ostreicida]
MLRPPSKMHAQIEALTALIRAPIKPPMSCRYREGIRDNLFDVLATTFPLFSAQFTEEQRTRMVNDFVNNHGASEPTFHHIATEFMQFLQAHRQATKHTVSSDQVALLEYEWVTFSIEIDPLGGPTSLVPHRLLEETDTLQITTGLQLLQLPFLLHQDSVTFFACRRHPIFYAVFRDALHHVKSQKLRAIDVAFIQYLQEHPSLTITQLQQHAAQHMAIFNVMEWIQNFNELGLVTAHPQEKNV